MKLNNEKQNGFSDNEEGIGLFHALLIAWALLYIATVTLVAERPRKPAFQQLQQDFRHLGQDVQTGLRHQWWQLVLVLSFCTTAILAWNRPNHRAMVSMTSYEFREVGESLNTYYKINGKYPPANAQKAVYTYVSDALTTPTPALEDFPSSPSHAIYKGPPVDPYRSSPLFRGEELAEAWYRDGKNSEGPAFMCWFEGYPPRYYRTEDGESALLLSNGPNQREDIDLKSLSTLTSSSYKDLVVHLRPFTYDPTNGLTSNGDLYLIVTPD